MSKKIIARLLCSFLWFCLSVSAAEGVQVACLVGDYDTVSTAKAIKHFWKRFPELKDKVNFTLVPESGLIDTKRSQFERVDILILDIHSKNIDKRLEEEFKIDLVRMVAQKGKVFAVGESLAPASFYQNMGVKFDVEVRKYWGAQGWRNKYQAFCYILATEYGFEDVTYQPVEPSLTFGYYHPDGEEGRVFTSYEEYERWYKKAGFYEEGKPWVAIPFYSSYYYQDQTGLLDALIAEVEKAQLNALPIFGYPATLACEKLPLDENGRCRPDGALSFMFKFANVESSKTLARLDIPFINLISLYGRSEEDWRKSATGLSLFEGTFQVAVPELAGLVAPIVVGTQEKVFAPQLGFTVVKTTPIPERVQCAVARIGRFIELRKKPNAEKKVAIMYYNYPPAKANVGASYLNVSASLERILRRLKEEGYDVGTSPITAEGILESIKKRGRNIGIYAPGELEEMIEAGQVVLVPLAQYKGWFDRYPPKFQHEVIQDWKEPGESVHMFYKKGRKTFLVVPAVLFGKVVLLPQPVRGWGQDLEKLYHAKDLAPPHQYCGVYAWIRYGFGADAVIHVGTHGTLEWLSGKDIGLVESDAPEALIADLPNIYPYNVDVVGEGLVAKRRGMAVIVDHMVPPLKKGGLYKEYAELFELINDHDAALSKSEELAQAYLEQVWGKVLAMGLEKELESDDLGKEGSLDHEMVHRLEEFLMEMKGQNMPYGLHTFGKAPEPKLRASTIETILEVEKNLSSKEREVKTLDLDKRIVISADRELESTMRALRGGYVLPGTGNDPVRNPDSLPTGKNFFGIDPTKVPKKAAWKLGVRLADQMLAEHLKKHNKYPEKVSFVIWGTETLRHEGVLESQIFYLLGTRPIWDERDKVVGVEVIPSSELGRPRIDIVIASAAEGMFAQLTQFLDEAVQMVNALKEEDNYVRKHSRQIKEKLIAKGYLPTEAEKRAGVRIFDEPPGTFNLNTSRIVSASGTWDDESVIVDDYFRKLGYGYGNGFWGEPMEDVFRLALSGTEKVVHSNSTVLYGTLDNDDFFMYAGGLVAAVRHLDGKSPELMITNIKDPSRPEMTSIHKMMGLEFRSRYTNPRWIEGMKKEGYEGARQMRNFVEYLWGWQVTVPKTVDAWKWQDVFEVYVKDKYKMDLKTFFETKSPFAYQDMTARMLETIRKGYWKAPKKVHETLAKEYLKSVNTFGVGCAEHTCGNPVLAQHAIKVAKAASVLKPDLEAFRKRIEEAMRTPLDQSVERMNHFVQNVKRKQSLREEHVVSGKAPLLKVKGYVMEKHKTSKNKVATSNKKTGLNWLAVPIPVVGIIIFVLGFLYIRKRHS
ncbi:MAG: cobaltochelatase subunit CobN [Candidatus Brocadiales bacterium]